MTAAAAFTVLACLGGLATDELVEVAALAACGLLLVQQR
jgi:hypothetical protein